MDFRISVEELESQAEIAEMARNLIREASQQVEEFENSMPTPLTEEVDVPLLNYFIQI
jgi:hypothetical protein